MPHRRLATILYARVTRSRYTLSPLISQIASPPFCHRASRRPLQPSPLVSDCYDAKIPTRFPNTGLRRFSGIADLAPSAFTNSRIIGLLLEAAFFGVFATTSAMGTWCLLIEKHLHTHLWRNRMLLALNALMFALALAHLALTTRMVLSDFSPSDGDMIDAMFQNDPISSPVGLAQFYMYVTQTVIGDIFMVYRLFVVWDIKNIWGKSIPIAMLVVDVACGYLLPRIPIAFFGVSFLSNALASALIMWRILNTKGAQTQDHWEWHSRAMFNLVRYRRAFEAIIQSAAIYSMTSISLLVTFFLGTEVSFVTCMNVFPPLIGFVFSLIILQMARKSVIEGPSQGRFSAAEIVALRPVIV